MKVRIAQSVNLSDDMRLKIGHHQTGGHYVMASNQQCQEFIWSQLGMALREFNRENELPEKPEKPERRLLPEIEL